MISFDRSTVGMALRGCIRPAFPVGLWAVPPPVPSPPASPAPGRSGTSPDGQPARSVRAEPKSARCPFIVTPSRSTGSFEQRHASQRPPAQEHIRCQVEPSHNSPYSLHILKRAPALGCVCRPDSGGSPKWPPETGGGPPNRPGMGPRFTQSSASGVGPCACRNDAYVERLGGGWSVVALIGDRRGVGSASKSRPGAQRKHFYTQALLPDTMPTG